MAKRKQDIFPERKFNLNELYFYLCGDCNLACHHCWISPTFRRRSVSEKALEFKLFKEIIAQAQPYGLNAVKLTGGEPLIHPDIEKILIHIRDRALQLTVETNGTLVTDKIAGLMQQCKNPFVAISIDGIKSTHDRIRGVQGCFDDACKGVEILAQQGLKPQIVMTVMRENQDQIQKVVHLAENLKAGSIKFNFVQPIERGALVHQKGEALTVREMIQLGNWMEQDLKKEAQIRLFISLPMAFRPLSSILEKGSCSVSCFIFNRLGVLSDGQYALCGIGKSMNELTFGDARDTSLQAVWENSRVLRLVREHLPRDLKGVCAECSMKWRCLGTCIAQNYYSQHDLFADYWFCRDAKRLGLFPDSRRLI